ncbi:branched-chain amino acid aminotransferase II [Xylariaceae sp. FL0804]|nr:branched-chain amino acid aminotransferase II [Xylariaceae sp. FL0804]
MSSFPPPPVSTIDWANVGFQVHEVNGHIECHYSARTGRWSAPKFVTDPFIRIHGMAPALNYGQQAYEGLKAFRAPGDGAIQVFRADRNAARMQHSARCISVPPVPAGLFLAAVRAAVALNAEYVPPHATGAALYVRPQVYGSSAQLGLTAPEEYMFCVYAMPTGVYHGTHPVDCLVLDEFDRAAPRGTGSAKVGGNYAPVLRWSDRARGQGYGITLHLDSATREEVDEFSTSGFIGVLRGEGEGEGDEVTMVVPDSRNVIESVTSESVCELGRSFGYKVERRSIKYSELPRFAEVMAAGTAAALVPVRSITRRADPASPQSLAQTVKSHPRLSVQQETEKITYLDDGNEEGGEICLRLLTQLRAIQLGKVKDDFQWCLGISREDGTKVTGETTTATNGHHAPSVDQLD